MDTELNDLTDQKELSVTKIKQPFFPVHSSSYIHQKRKF